MINRKYVNYLDATLLLFILEERLLEYAARIVRLVEQLPDTRAGSHVAGQLLRSGTSPLPNHGEAQGAESRRDFIHKLRICHKELRESRRWLRLIQQVPLLETGRVQPLVEETDELIHIFAASLRTAQQPKRLNVERFWSHTTAG
jgi:four helix bundle protein